MSDDHNENPEGYEKLEKIGTRVERGDKVDSVTVRELLKWFGANHRGIQINRKIRAALSKNNLYTKPELYEQSLDGLLKFTQGLSPLGRLIDSKGPIEFRPGKPMTADEAEVANAFWVETLGDRVSGWVDQHPAVTPSEIQAKADTLAKLDFDELEREESADKSANIIRFPASTHYIGLSLSLNNVPTMVSANSVVSADTARFLAIRHRRMTSAKTETEKRHLERLHIALGRFIFEFSQLEFVIRHALAEALGLDNDRFHTITSSYDFAALSRVTQSIYRTVPGCTDQERTELEEIFNECLKINEKRVRIVHGTWFIDKERLGTEHVSRSSLKPTIYYSRIEDIDKVSSDVERLKSRLVTFLIGPRSSWPS